MRELLEYIARGLVEDPDQVEVEEFEEDDGEIVLELTVAPDDMGKVIGRRGRVARALRQLVRTAAAREGLHATVDIVDEISEPLDDDEDLD